MGDKSEEYLYINTLCEVHVTNHDSSIITLRLCSTIGFVIALIFPGENLNFSSQKAEFPHLTVDY